METASTSTPLPPGGLFEILFSFDTTGSMSSVIDEVKGRLQDMIQRLQADIPGIRFGVLAHGDYCDKDVFYLEKHIDLTRDIKQLCDFVSGVEGTGGGDPEECYELVLNLAGKFSWTLGSQKALVVIGDSEPHNPEYDLNVDNLDWREEAKKLAAVGIKVYGVQAFENDASTAFFQELTELTSGQHLKLGNFSHVCDFIMAICYRERGEEFLEGYEAEVRAREARKAALHPDLEGLFGTLRRGDSSASKTGSLRTSASISSEVSGLPAPPLVPKMLSSLSSMASRISPSRSGSPTPSRSRSGSPVSRSGSPSPVGSPASLSPVGSLTPVGSSKFPTAVVRPIKGPPLGVMKTGKYPPIVCKLPRKIIKPIEKKTVPKIHRHTVPDKDFLLKKNNLARRWSPWKLSIMNQDPPNTRNWVACTIWRSKLGCRRRQLFQRDSRSARVLYEIAVQTTKRGKMHIMFSKWGWTNANPLNWCRGLLGKPIIAKQVSGALKADFKIYVRRCVLNRLGKNQQKAVKQWRKTYSYAWADGVSVIKNKCVISS